MARELQCHRHSSKGIAEPELSHIIMFYNDVFDNLMVLPVGPLGLCVPIAGARNARRWCVAPPVRQLDQPSGQTGVSHLCLAKLVHCPASLATHHHALFDEKAWGKHEVYQTGLQVFRLSLSDGL